jgi:hypothetical protein
MDLYKTAFEISLDLAKEWLPLAEPRDEDVMNKLKFMRAHGALEPNNIIREAKALHKFARSILEMAKSSRTIGW